MSWKDTIQDKETKSWKDTVQDTTQSGWKSTIEDVPESESFLEFIDTEKTYSPEVQAEARKYLEEQGYNKDNVLGDARAFASSFADMVSFGGADWAKSQVMSRFNGKSPEELRDVYGAASQIMREENPVADISGSVAGALVPGLGVARAAKLGVKGAARVAGGLGLGQDVGVDVSRAEEGEEAKAAGVAAGIGLTAGLVGEGVIRGVSKAYKTGKQAAAKRILEDSGFDSDQADRVAKQFAEEKAHLDETIKTVESLSDKQRKQFSELILDGVPLEEAKRYGDLDDALDNYRELLARRKAIFKQGGLDPEKTSEWATFFVDSQYVGDMIDRRWGTDVMRTMNDLSDDMNKSLHISKALKEQGKAVLKEAKLTDPEQSKRIIKEIEAGKVTPETESFKQMFDTMARTVNEAAGTDVIKLRKNYVPHYTKAAPEMQAILRKRIKDTVGQTPVQITPEVLDAIKSDKGLLDSLDYLGKFTKDADNNFTQLDKDIAEFLPSVYSNRIFSEPENVVDLGAASIRKRKLDDVPELIREYDMGRLIGGWSDSVAQDVLMRKNLRKLKAQGLSLKDKDPNSARYITGYLNDLGGQSRGLAGISSRTSRAWSSRLLENSMNSLDKAKAAKAAGNTAEAWMHTSKSKLYDGASRVPRLGQFLQGQMYPAFLGLRVDANLRNLTQPYVYTVQQISSDPKYQAKLAATNLLDSAVTSVATRRGVTKQRDPIKRLESLRTASKDKLTAVEELEQRGLMPPDPTPGMFKDLRDGLGTTTKAGEGLEKLNNTAMYLYQQGDIANRIVTMNMGKTVAKDAMKQHPEALKYITKLPSSYRRAATQALKAGDQDALEDLFIKHLNSTTQFNYNRASMSEYGRVMGSVFNMFSKWPTAITGDIVNTIDQGRLRQAKRKSQLPGPTKQLLNKYAGPYLGLMATNALLTGATQDDIADAVLELEREESPMTDFFLPKYSGLTGSAPLTSATQLISRPDRQLVPPAIQSISEISQGKLDTAAGILPGYVYARFATERLPLLIDEEGKKPMSYLKEDVLDLD